MANIAFLGLGVMGSHMAANLVRAGNSVQVWNRTANKPGVSVARDAGCVVHVSISSAVRNADFIFVCVSDTKDVHQVILGPEGVLANIKPGSIIIDISTIGPAVAQEIAGIVQKVGSSFMDAPVSGGDEGARSATLTFMIGGSEVNFQAALPLFKSMGKNIFRCGEVGSGQAIKLCNQVLCAVHMVALCEAFKVAEAAGVDPALMVKVCSTGAGASWALEKLGPRILSGNLDTGFAVPLMRKDLRLVKENSGELPGVTLADQQFRMVEELWRTGDNSPATQAMALAYGLSDRIG